MTGSEQVDQAAAGDGVRAPMAGTLEVLGLRRADPLQHRLRRRQPAQRGQAVAAGGSLAKLVGVGIATGRGGGRLALGPALRALKSSRIVLVAVAPMRVTPSTITSSSASSVRTASLWLRRGACVGPHQAQVLVGGAGGSEAGRRLDEVGAGRSVTWQARIFSSSVRYAFLKITFTIAPPAWATSTTARMSCPRLCRGV